MATAKIDSNGLDYVVWLLSAEGRQARAAVRHFDAIEQASERIAEDNAAALEEREQERARWREERAAHAEWHNAAARERGVFETERVEADALRAVVARLEADVTVAAAFVAKVTGANAERIAGFVRARDAEGYSEYMSGFKGARAA